MANGLSKFSIKDDPIFSNGPKNLPRNPLILFNWVFDNSILAKELFAKALQSLEACIVVNNNLCGQLFSSLESPTTYEEIHKVTSVPTFVPDFNLLCCKLDNFTFKMLY